MDMGKNIKKLRLSMGMTQHELALKVGYKSRSSVNKVEAGDRNLDQSMIMKFAKALHTTPAVLMGWEEPDTAPIITEDYVTFDVMGEIAAGYDSPPLSASDVSFEGEKIDIPASYLKGRDRKDFFVLKIKGDSMFPTYQENDYVLILIQSTLDYSGQVGAVLYDTAYATLKKIEYKQGESWLKLVPINPIYPVTKISDNELERCRILGVPQLLIRQIND